MMQTPDNDAMSDHGASYGGHTGDMGVELGLPDFRTHLSLSVLVRVVSHAMINMQ